MSETRELYVAYTNSDCTEGRGYDVPIAVCESRTAAVRLAKKRYVQGSDGPVRKLTTVKIDCEWFISLAAVHVVLPSKEDIKASPACVAATGTATHSRAPTRSKPHDPHHHRHAAPPANRAGMGRWPDQRCGIERDQALYRGKPARSCVRLRQTNPDRDKDPGDRDHDSHRAPHGRRRIATDRLRRRCPDRFGHLKQLQAPCAPGVSHTNPSASARRPRLHGADLLHRRLDCPIDRALEKVKAAGITDDELQALIHD